MVEYQVVQPTFELHLPTFERKYFYNTPTLDCTPQIGTNVMQDNLYNKLLEAPQSESNTPQSETQVQTSNNLTQAIQKHLGENYSQSRRNQTGFSDCSSFVGKVLKDAGITAFQGLPTAASMYESNKLISVSKAQPGDLIFFRGTDNRGKNYVSHIGIVADVDTNGNPTKMAHASARQYKKTVVVDYNPNYWNKFKPEIKRLKI